MIPELTNQAAATALEEIKVLYGPPPVLKTESPEAYYKIMSRYLEVLKPREFIEMTFIPHLTGERLLRVSSEIIEAVALPKQIASSNIPLAEQQP